MNKQDVLEIMQKEDVKLFNQFVTAPASTKWHGARVRGLLDHSEAVTDNLLSWRDKHPGTILSHDDCVICGMLHDLCKADLYIKVGSGYIYDKTIVAHHAKRSVEIIEQRLSIKLTTLQRVLILLHMSSWSNDEDIEALTDEDKEWLSNPKNIILVQAMNWADMKATNEDK